MTSSPHPDGSWDTVPDRRHTHLATVTMLLQEANMKNDALVAQIERQRKEYAVLRDEVTALKYRRWCSQCQLRRLSDGEVPSCPTCSKKEKTLQTLLEESENKVRYWQRCYETLLEVHYGGGNDDGTHGGLQ